MWYGTLINIIILKFEISDKTISIIKVGLMSYLTYYYRYWIDRQWFRSKSEIFYIVKWLNMYLEVDIVLVHIVYLVK